MMQTKVINQKGKESAEKITLDKSVWGLPKNDDLIAQVVFVFQQNRRMATAAAKSRGAVSGGGRKPFRQKGTGRARAGSIRSPLWSGGGVTFTPNDRNWKRRINDKMKKKALSVVLSSRVTDETLKFVKFSSKSESKVLRQDLASLASKLKTLIVSEEDSVLKSVRNLENFKIVSPVELNVFDALDNKSLLIDVKSLDVIEKRLKNGK